SVRVRWRALGEGPANAGSFSSTGPVAGRHRVSWRVCYSGFFGFARMTLERNWEGGKPALARHGEKRRAPTMSQMSLSQLPDDQPPPRSPRPSRPGEYLTIAEAAEAVRCCERTIRRAIDNGDLRAGKVRSQDGHRGGFRIHASDLDEWLFRDAS